jgi:hypothetical protein
LNIENTEIVDIADNQDAFEDEFYQRTPEEDEVDNEPVDEDVDEDVEDDNPEEDDNPLDPDEDEDDEDEHEEDDDRPRAKTRKNTVQERINELTADKHEARRMAEAAIAREEAIRKEFEALKASVEKGKAPESKELRDRLPDGAPSPDAKDDEGEPLYPLGEFDPQYITDLTKFTIERETKAANERAAQEAQAREFAKVQQEIADTWIERVNEVEKEIPELRDEMKTLTETFHNIEPAYGEYLASTIMISEVGPEIMHYLSQNIGEAQSIVASGPAAATLALGRLEARLMKSSTSAEKEKSNKKVSSAPPPPENLTRGKGSRFSVAPDTDNQDAFEEMFFQKN